MDSDELKPCPNPECGSDELAQDGWAERAVFCYGCGMNGPRVGFDWPDDIARRIRPTREESRQVEANAWTEAVRLWNQLLRDRREAEEGDRG